MSIPDRLTHLALRHVNVYICRSPRRPAKTHSKSDLPQGTLDMLILQVVALGPIHGYAIAQRFQQISRDVVHVRPALHRLENRGWLAATWARFSEAIRQILRTAEGGAL